MPELPEVETVVRGLNKFARGRRITGVKVSLPKIINLNPALFRKRLLNSRILCTERRAKIIMIHLSNGYSLGVHLKMSGRLVYTKGNSTIEKHTHVIMNLDNGFDLRYWDLRQFGYVRLFPTGKISEGLKLDLLGPEPLEKSFTINKFTELLKTRPHTRIKPLLMDQGFIAGIGNLYADEILYCARVHPLRRVNSLKEPEIKGIFREIKKILPEAIRKRGSSVELYVGADGKPGEYHKYLKAYSREGAPCSRCRAKIIRIKIGQRSAYFCPKCQR
ncbi:MAG: DNA-formamidopyrimidine glycosylase [Planctomycetes bacterium]|nr:DNA-formamidopyrimidine glycosylase [Planctomycetota bacterium]